MDLTRLNLPELQKNIEETEVKVDEMTALLEEQWSGGLSGLFPVHTIGRRKGQSPKRKEAAHMESAYPQQRSDVRQLYAAVQSNPPERGKPRKKASTPPITAGQFLLYAKISPHRWEVDQWTL